MIAWVFPALSYPLAQDFLSPLQPQCLLQKACPPPSISGCSEECCHINQISAFCRQREHGWHSNRPKQLLPSFSGTGSGHCNRREKLPKGMKGAAGPLPWALPRGTFLPQTQQLTLQKLGIGFSVYVFFCPQQTDGDAFLLLGCSLIRTSEDTSWQGSKCLGWALVGKYRERKNKVPANISVQGCKSRQ